MVIKRCLNPDFFWNLLVTYPAPWCSNALIPDHNAYVFKPPPTQPEFDAADSFVNFFFGGFRRWDALQFLHIAEHGYVYQHSAAFFPGFPGIVRVIGELFRRALFMERIMSMRNILLLAAVIINLIAFTISAIMLHKIVLKATKSRNTALIAVVLHCMSPASIFFTTAYSESVFAAASYTFFWLLDSGHIRLAALPLALATFSRPNGVVLIGFLLVQVLKSVLFAPPSSIVTTLQESATESTLVRSKDLPERDSTSEDFIEGDSTDERERLSRTGEDNSDAINSDEELDVNCLLESDEDNRNDRSDADTSNDYMRSSSVKSEANAQQDDPPPVPSLKPWFVHACSEVVVITSTLLFGLFPFFIFQEFIHFVFCTFRDGKETDNPLLFNGIDSKIVTYGNVKGFPLVGSSSNDRMCTESIVKVPFLGFSFPYFYSYIQRTHWDVGLFKYWTVKQIPNFLLALPVIYFSLHCSLSCIKLSWKILRRKRQGSLSNWIQPLNENEKVALRRFAHGGHLAFLCISGIFAFHVQILTRLIFSATPIIYEWLACGIYSNIKEALKKKDKELADLSDLSEQDLLQVIWDHGKSKDVCIYFGVFFVVGTVLHSNFMPWT